MNKFELNYDWDNAEQAYWNKTDHHIAHGKLIVLRLNNENEEKFKTRAEKLAIEQLRHINKPGKSLCPAMITKYEFIMEDEV